MPADASSHTVPDQRTVASRGRDIRILHLTRADWALLRMVRLGALQDSPRAFTSTYEHEATDDEAAWRRRFDAADWLVAVEQGQPVGLACLAHHRATDEDCCVESVWVAPEHRRRGVLRSLVRRLVELGARTHREALLLWVAVDNVIALRAYARLGFRSTANEQPFGTVAGRVERQLRLDVRS